MLAMAMKRMKKEEKGFTLIELLAVIVILGIIAAIAVPLILGAVNKSKKDADLATAQQIYDAARLYITSELHGNYNSATVLINTTKPNTNSLETLGYLENDITLPSTKAKILGGQVEFDTNGHLTRVVISTNDEAIDAADPVFTAEQLKK